MKKILYYLPNFILGGYAIIYIPIWMRLVEKFHLSMTPLWDAERVMDKLSWNLIIISCILKLFFKSKKFELKELEKKIGIILFVIEIVLIFYLGVLISFA